MRGFTLKGSEYFEGLTQKDAKEMFNNMFTSENTQPMCDTKEIDKVQVPESYSFYDKHPKCRFDNVQQKCSSSYVESHMNLYRNKICAQNNSDFEPSVEYAF